MSEKTMPPSEDIAALFVGSWSLVSWVLTRPDGVTEYPFGEDAVGWIMYTQDRRMAAHLMRRGRALLKSERLRESTAEERAADYLDHFSYCGTYSVESDAKTVTHHVDVSSSPNWVGSDRARTFHFSGDTLTLGAALADGSKNRLVWKRR
jgi:hypothetical protein